MSWFGFGNKVEPASSVAPSAAPSSKPAKCDPEKIKAFEAANNCKINTGWFSGGKRKSRRRRRNNRKSRKSRRNKRR
jgi:hypothetical protein